MFYNIHTHQSAKHPDEWALINVSNDFDKTRSLSHCSIGLHPWYIKDETLANEVLQLKTTAGQNNVFAIGECGLDRMCETDWDLQLKAFQIQIALSNQLRKPLIIHAVRAHQDVLQQLHKYHHQQPVIFHGVNHKGIATLWQAGHYISFGKALLNPQSEAAKAFRAVPNDSYFLETDDADISIRQVYEAAAAIKHVSVDAIKDQVEQNFRSIFAA